MLKYLFVSYLGIPNAFLVIVCSSIAKISLDITYQQQLKFKEPRMSMFGPLMPNSQRFFFHQQYVLEKKTLKALSGKSLLLSYVDLKSTFKSYGGFSDPHYSSIRQIMKGGCIQVP